MRTVASRRAVAALQLAAATSPLHLPLLTSAIVGGAAITLADGTQMPAIGYGTCCRPSANGPPLVRSTTEYLAQGGRLIDTAQMYGNEAALSMAIRESRLPRSELWITNKINTGPWSGDGPINTRAGTLASVEKSLSLLRTDYVDLMLIHGTWVLSEAQQLEVWRGLIDAKTKGYVKRIGVSNFVRSEIETLEKATGVRPCINQLEYHPWVPKETTDLVRWCQKEGIAVTAYGSLGGSGNKAGELGPAMSANVGKVAEVHGCSNAQVLLRWALNKGVAVIPGATSAEHIRDNLNVPPFELTRSDEQLLARARPQTFRRWRNLSEEIEACTKRGAACV